MERGQDLLLLTSWVMTSTEIQFTEEMRVLKQRTNARFKYLSAISHWRAGIISGELLKGPKVNKNKSEQP